MTYYGTIEYSKSSLSYFGLVAGANSIVSLIMWYNVYRAIQAALRRKQLVYYMCTIMNLGMAAAFTPSLLKPLLVIGCAGFRITTYISYVICTIFAGLILTVKAYYASDHSRILLAIMLTGQLVTLGLHLAVLGSYDSVHDTYEQMCEPKISETSLLLTVIVDFSCNCLFSGIFIWYVFRASRKFSTNLYNILVRDGMLYWICASSISVATVLVLVLGVSGTIFPYAFAAYSKYLVTICP
ncbi:hypothetical protein IWQ62_002733 [Dispira parvispora]|uniref:Uncharacterized protein n=1 Tax=Dispira parvispora TaxID=1520584 RepID=A0A9W8E767_9FUNG|nr:hypothetical protein IWQ62_002733 [Dispira parvispora]